MHPNTDASSTSCSDLKYLLLFQMSVVMSHLAADEDKELLQGYIADLIDKFASNKRWTHRQA